MYESKHLGYQIKGVDSTKGKQEGYELCLNDVGEKFDQNNDLLFMLKATNPKLIVEAAND